MFVRNFIDEFQKYRVMGEKAMTQVSDDALNAIPVAEGNSIAMLARHVGGNLVSRFTDFLTSDGEKPWRDRDSEFEERDYTRAEAEQWWAKGFDALAASVGKLSDEDLARTITIRGTELTVHEALCRSLAHAAMHTGQIILLAKIAAGKNWKTLSIPKGKSQEYNKDAKLEKATAYSDALSKLRGK